MDPVAASRRAGGFRLDGKCVHAARQLVRKCLIDQSMHLDTGFAGEGRALDPDAKMRFDATGMDAGMPPVLIRFIDHFEPYRLERRCQYVGDSIASHHAKQCSTARSASRRDGRADEPCTGDALLKS